MTTRLVTPIASGQDWTFCISPFSRHPLNPGRAPENCPVMVNCVQNQTCLDDVNSATREAQESDAFKTAPWGNSNFEAPFSCSHETKECHQSDAAASIVGTVVPIFLVALVFFSISANRRLLQALPRIFRPLLPLFFQQPLHLCL